MNKIATDVITSVMSSVMSMSEADLRTINNMVITELRYRHAKKVAEIKNALNVGDKVKFMSKRGLQVGTLTRFKQKNAEVLVGHTRWTVTPTLLTKV